MDTSMKGRRREDNTPPHELAPGDYSHHPKDNSWFICTPNGMYGHLVYHHVEEHEDGTISVVPIPESSNSILVEAPRHGKTWHGYIRRGVWQSL